MFISTNNLFKTDQNDSPMFTQSEQSFTDTLRKNVTRQLNKTNSNKTQNVSSTTSTPTTNSTPRELTSKRNAWDATDTSSKNNSNPDKNMYNAFLEGFYHDKLGDRQRQSERKQYQDTISRAGTKDSTLDPFLDGFYSAAKDEQGSYSQPENNVPIAQFLHKEELPKASFHKKEEPRQPGTEDDWRSYDYNEDEAILGAANEYAQNIIDKAYRLKRNGWYDSYTAGLSPYDTSELKNAENKITGAKGVTQLENGAINALATVAELGVGRLTGGASILSKAPKEILEEIVKSIPKEIAKEYIFNNLLNLPTVGDLVKDSITPITKHSIDNAQDYFDYINGGDHKYLINSKRYRDVFTARLQEELDKISATEKFGFLPQEESDRFKTAVSNRLNALIYLNENYEQEKQIADEKWERFKNQWGKEFPKIVTDY